MVMTLPRIIAFVVLTHTAFGAARVTASLYALSNKASPFTVGVLLALYALVPALLAVRAGRWLDEVGPFRPLLLGTVMMTVGALLPAAFPYATADVAPLLVASALLGTGFMYVQMTMQNLVGIMSEPGSRPAAFSMLALGFSTSGLIAPVASGFLIDSVGHRATFALIFVLMSVSVVILLVQRALLPAPRPHATATESRNPFDLLRYPAVRNVLIVSGMISMSWDLQQFLIPVYGTSIGLSASQIGLVLGSFAAATFSHSARDADVVAPLSRMAGAPVHVGHRCYRLRADSLFSFVGTADGGRLPARTRTRRGTAQRDVVAARPIAPAASAKRSACAPRS